MTWPFIVTGAGLALAAFLGWEYHGTGSGALAFFLIAGILAVLEISLSFDNAIVNANKLKQMVPKWQRRFLTWGILIAVFGMRVIFPLLVVVIAAHLAPWEALRLAATQPQEYSRIIHEAHLPIAAFGGSFLMLVALNYFFDEAKDVDWIKGVEAALRKLGEIRGMEVGFVLICMLVIVGQLPAEKEHAFIIAAIWGVITYLLVDMLGHVLDRWGGAPRHADMARGGFGARFETSTALCRAAACKQSKTGWLPSSRAHSAGVKPMSFFRSSRAPFPSKNSAISTAAWRS